MRETKPVPGRPDRLHEVLGGPISNWAKRLVKKMR
jgi:hypothetical protein